MTDKPSENVIFYNYSEKRVTNHNSVQ